MSGFFFVILLSLEYFTGRVCFFRRCHASTPSHNDSYMQPFCSLSYSSSLANISQHPKRPSLMNMSATHVGCYTANVVLFDSAQEACDLRGRNDTGERFLKQITQFCIQDIFKYHLHRASQGLTICLQLFVEPQQLVILLERQKPHQMSAQLRLKKKVQERW